MPTSAVSNVGDRRSNCDETCVGQWVELEFEFHGSGEPVLLIHAADLADAFAPLLPQPQLSNRYRLIHYHRRGYGGRSRAAPPVSIAQHAADARALLHHVGVARAHIVGHSYGGVIALQLALDAPEAVHSLALLEPTLSTLVPSGAQFLAGLAPVFAAYQAGDTAAAVDTFLQQVVGRPDYRTAFDHALPAGWFEQAVADADTQFQVEMPALREWEFSRELAGRISQPVLIALGAECVPRFSEIHALLQQWLPQAETFVLSGATHAMQIENPRDLAEALAGFFARHPLPVAA